MQPGRSPPAKEVFLGTAEIIRRVRDAQASPLTRWMGAARFYALVALSGVVAAALGVVAWHERYAGAAHTATPELLQNAKAPPAVAQPPRHAVGGPLRASPGRHASKQAVTVRLARQHAAAFWVDGAKVADHKNFWEGHLVPGRHELAVRVQGHMLRHTFEVGAHPVLITVDPVSHAITVAGHQGGHRTARSH